MDTTRRYPRTLQQAFPRDCQHAYPIEHYRRERYESVAGYLLAISIGVSLALALVSWWAS